MPWKSQIALALWWGSCDQSTLLFDFRGYLRLRVDLIQEPAAVILVKHACEAPRVILKWLYILDLHEEDVPRFGGLDFEGPREVVDLG